MTAVDSEIDSFIRQQKAKLANERQNLNLEPASYDRGNARRKWGPPVDLDTFKNTEKDNYKRTWYELKGKYLEPSSSRRQVDSTMKLSPRGVLDTGALILDVQKEKEREEYEELWRQRHGGKKPTPRLPINHAPINRVVGGTTVLSDPRKANGFPPAQRQSQRDEYKQLWEQYHPEGNKYRPAENIGVKQGALDIDQIIQDVQRENMEEEVRMGGQTVVAPPNVRTNARDLDRRKKRAPDDVNRQGGSLFDDSQQNIQNKIAEAKQEADNYRKRWEGQNSKGQEAQNSRSQNYGLLIEEDGRLEKIRQQRQERNREYNEYLARKRRIPSRERYNLTPEFDESEDFGLFHNLGMEDKKKQQMREPPSQLNLPHQNFNKEKNQREYQRHPLGELTDEYKVFSLGANESDAVKKIKERNEEYNQFLMAKNEKGKNRFSDKKPSEDGGIFATIPGLRYSTSAQKKEMAAERNREYNELLRKKTQNRNQRGTDAPLYGPKQGWSTPTYEEVLDQKRAEESNYRRANGYETSPHTLETERRLRELQRGLADNPIALDPGSSELVRAQKDMLSRLRDIDGDVKLKDDTKTDAVKSKPPDLPEKNYQDTDIRMPYAEVRSVDQRGRKQQVGQYIGSQALDPRSEKQRRQEEYKKELQQQMAETAYARRREKEEGIPINTTEIINREPMHLIYGGRETNRKDPAVEAYHTKILDSLKKLDEISPLSNAILSNKAEPAADNKFSRRLNLIPNPVVRNRQPVNADTQGGGILDLGFGPVLEPARLTSLDPPPGLLYQPSTYVTASAVPALNNSVDEAYSFYASHNPLDPYLTAGGVQDGRELGGDVPVPSLDLSRAGRDGGPSSRVRFREGRPQEAPTDGMVFASDQDRKGNQRQQQSFYREELERQMKEKKLKKVQDKEAQERYDLKMEEEAKTYDPFGKGGGGAPMRDNYGNVITDLRQMRNDNVYRENKFSPRGYDKGDVGQSGNTTRAAVSYRDDLIGPPPVQTTAEGETSFARGGHGIFGMPKTDAEKLQADRYKLELQRQMEEKRAEEYRRKQLERLEEERQQKIVEEQRAKMQREFEEEQRKIRDKEEEARRRNEELIRITEEKKRENDRRRREAEEQRQQDLREERERDIIERQREEEAKNRGKSPVIPALRRKTDVKQDEKKTLSPPVPAARTKTIVDPLPFEDEYVPRTHSADVLNQLAHMRAQLRNERKRVQTMLNDQQDDVDIFDPRISQRPQPVPVIHTKPDFDVFETAMNRNAVAVRRTPAERANPQAVEDFNALKHKKDSDSRKQFRKLFPDEPITAEALESQQAALLRQQEQRLLGIRERSAYEGTPPLPLNRDTHSSSSQLQSKSAFVEVNNIGHFPDDFEDIPRRNDSARSKRRNRASSSPRMTSPGSRSLFGSQTSLNVDKLARKNEDRLKKLRELQGDDVSLYDPEDVLERFMSKQGHNRPPSGNTLLDDTWMKTGIKTVKS